MIYIPRRLELPNRLFRRFLFTDIFIKDNNIGLVSIVYPDEDIKFNDIVCIVDGREYYFTYQIINRVYESNVFLMTESDELNRYIKGKKNITCHIKYGNVEGTFQLEKFEVPQKNLVLTTLFKDDYYLLPSWIEYNRLLGVDYFILYYNKKIDDRVLDLIGDMDDVLIIEWDLVHKLPEILGKDSRVKLVDKRLEKNHHHAQPMSMCHCLNYLGSKSKWIGFLDLDEYLIMKDLFNINDLLNRYAYSETAGIKFHCRWARLDNCNISQEDPQDSLKILKKFNTIRKVDTEGTFFRTKVIVNPTLTMVCNVHRLKKYKKKTNEIMLNTDDYYFLHYFNLNCGWGGRDKRNPFKGDVKLTLENRLHQLIKYNQNFI